jgi:hypothetical protein
MRMTATCLALLVLACCTDCTGCADGVRSQRRIIVFEDITMSLAKDQATAAQNIVNEIVDKAPDGAELVVVPICENTDNAPEISEIIPFTGLGLRAKEDAREARKALKQEIAKSMQDILKGTKAATSGYASCVSPSLRVSQRVMRTPSPDKNWVTDIIFVSDMIEECQTSILGQTVRLKTADDQFDAAKKLVGGNQRLMDVANARVFVILPKAISTTRLNRDYPSPVELHAFWERLFARSGITANRLWWDANVSQYLESIRR